MTPDDIRKRADNVEEHADGNIRLTAAVLRACADVVEAVKDKPRLNWPELNIALARLKELKP